MSTFRSLFVTRRGLGLRLAGAAAAAGLGTALPVAANAVAPTVDPVLRDAALRGLALAGYRGDAINNAAAEAALSRLAQADPEGALLVQIYRRFDVRPAGYWHDAPEAASDDLATLHEAVDLCRPVAFSYTDLSDQVSNRTALPLAIVHPPQGVKLIAWCQKREDFRQFFVRSMQQVNALPGDFSAQRFALLSALVEKECGQA